MFKKLAASGVAFFALAACTPEQLAQIQKFHAVDFSDEQEANFLSLPDEEYRQGRISILPDGSIVERPCLEPAAPEAHFYGDLSAARQTYWAVACERGWRDEAIAQMEPFIVDDVIAKESMGCFNISRGSIRSAGTSCLEGGLTRHSDTGYGQVIGINYSPSSKLCAAEGICSKAEVAATPRSSMTALLFLVEINGKQPWCWSAWARSYHWTCNSTPARIWPW